MARRPETVSTLIGYLTAAAQGLAAVNAADHVSALRGLADGLSPLSRFPLDRLFAAMRNVPAPSASTEGQTVDHAAESIFCFVSARNIIDSKARQTLERLHSSLAGELCRMSIRDFVEALKERVDIPRVLQGEALSDAYIRELTEQLHNAERFRPLFEHLTNDNRLKASDVAAVASGVAYAMPKSTPRKLALERIWKMHDASESFAAKSGGQRSHT
jgi:hypothetical protein